MNNQLSEQPRWDPWGAQVRDRADWVGRPYAHQVISVPDVVYLAFYWACIVLGVVAFIDAATRRTDAFLAVGRLSKPAWLGLLGGGTLCQVVVPVMSAGILGMLGLAGIVASIVYLVDIRGKIISVTRGPRY